MKSAIFRLLCLTLFLLLLVACSESPPVASVSSPVVGITQASSPSRSTRPPVPSVATGSTSAPPSRPAPSASATVVPSAVLAPTEEGAALSATVFNGGNVRETPVNGRPLDQINARETVRLLGKNEAGSWYLVTNTRGVTGWVSTTLLTIEPAVAAQVSIAPASAVAIAPGAQPDLGQGSGPTASASQLPDGWRVQQAGQFQLALPNSWQVLPVTRTDLERLVASVEKSNPRLAQVVQQLLQSDQYQQMRFAAADVSSRGDATANVNVIVTPRDVTQPVKQTLEATIKQLLQSLPTVNLIQSNTALRLNGMDGARIVYDLPLRRPDGGTVIVRGVQYYLIDGSNINILTLTGPPDAAFVTTADMIGRSLKTNATSHPAVVASAPPSAIVSTGRVTNGGNLRSAPVLAADTVIGQVCPDDQVALIVAQERGGASWYRIRVLSIAQDCATKRVQVGAEGWVNSTLIGPLLGETPTTGTVEPTPTAP